MTGIDKLMCRAACLVVLATLSASPARAQFGGGGGEDMMTRMAPMLEMMKAKMGKRRFTVLMQAMGPMMSDMMEGGGGMGGGFGGMMSGGSGGFGGGMAGFDGGQMMTMIPQIISMVNMGGGHRHHRRRHRHAR